MAPIFLSITSISLFNFSLICIKLRGRMQHSMHWGAHRPGDADKTEPRAVCNATMNVPPAPPMWKVNYGVLHSKAQSAWKQKLRKSGLPVHTKVRCLCTRQAAFLGLRGEQKASKTHQRPFYLYTLVRYEGKAEGCPGGTIIPSCQMQDTYFFFFPKEIALHLLVRFQSQLTKIYLLQTWPNYSNNNKSQPTKCSVWII